MSDMITTLAFYIRFPFVRYALIVGVLIALCSSLLGVTLVLKRFSYIGDGLSHVAFGAMAVAAVLNLTNDTLLVMPVTVVAAILLLRTGQNTKIHGDAAIAMLSVGSLAVGYLLLNLFSTSTNINGDVCGTLFGSTSILTLTTAEVWLCVAASVVVIFIYVFFYNKIFAVTFDENFSKASGVKVNFYNTLISIFTAVTVVIGVKMMGAMLISSLIIFPSLTSMRVYKSFLSVTICSAVIAMINFIAGLIASYVLSIPAGASVVVANLIMFVAFIIVGNILNVIRLRKYSK